MFTIAISTTIMTTTNVKAVQRCMQHFGLSQVDAFAFFQELW